MFLSALTISARLSVKRDASYAIEILDGSFLCCERNEEKSLSNFSLSASLSLFNWDAMWINFPRIVTLCAAQRVSAEIPSMSLSRNYSFKAFSSSRVRMGSLRMDSLSFQWEVCGLDAFLCRVCRTMKWSDNTVSLMYALSARGMCIEVIKILSILAYDWGGFEKWV